MKNTLIFIVLVTMLSPVVSCKKDKGKAPVAYENYSKLRPGNYWVYEHFDMFGTGPELPNGIDSIYVEKDTAIRDRTFYKLMISRDGHSAEVHKILSDSAHYIINQAGVPVFSSMDFANIFFSHVVMNNNDTVAEVRAQMADKDFAVQVPAGVFSTVVSRKSYYFHPPYQPLGTTRNEDARYAKDIGVVSEIFDMYSNGAYSERRLIRYHLQ
jgi:hypothetical protein